MLYYTSGSTVGGSAAGPIKTCSGSAAGGSAAGGSAAGAIETCSGSATEADDRQNRTMTTLYLYESYRTLQIY